MFKVAVEATNKLTSRGYTGSQVKPLLERLTKETSLAMMRDALESGVTVQEAAGRWVAVLLS